jgi:formylglycine-generating enzyme required for sulfatase activity
MLMVYVPGGTFQMGSDPGDPNAESDEFPQHPVTLDSYWIDQTEVTNGQYQQCAKAGPCSLPGSWFYRGSYTRNPYYGDSAFDDYPVLDVSWFQAAEYCEWAGARLPSEAEWEYAARGPEGLLYPWGNEFLWSRLNSWEDRDGYDDTAPVGSYRQGTSWCGALDLAGNVQEWVANRFLGYPSNQLAEIQEPDSGDWGVLRGGSWRTFKPDELRSTHRRKASADTKHETVGFRCARDSE